MIAAAPPPSAAPLAEGSAPAGAPAAPADPSRSALPPSTAGAAVESALQIGDLQAQAQGSQSAVNLRFKVGGENLSVRVAVQAGEVHAQFNTDSGELRTALAQAWPAVAAAPGAARFADPVFAAAPRGGSETMTDLGGGARQQSGGQSQADEDTGAGWSRPGARLGAGPAPASPAPAPASAPAGAAASPRLQTFA